MTEMKFQEIMNKNRCPAEYVCEVTRTAHTYRL